MVVLRTCGNSRRLHDPIRFHRRQPRSSELLLLCAHPPRPAAGTHCLSGAGGDRKYGAGAHGGRAVSLRAGKSETVTATSRGGDHESVPEPTAARRREGRGPEATALRRPPAVPVRRRLPLPPPDALRPARMAAESRG